MNSYPCDKFQNRTIIINKESMFHKSNLLLGNSDEKYIDKIIVSKGLILDRIETLAHNIIKDFSGKKVILLCVMKGAIQFNSALTEKIVSLLKSDLTKSQTLNFSVEYISISSYSGEKSTGQVKIKEDEKILEKIRGQNIIIVEDCYDSGLTMEKLIEYLFSFKPNLVKTAVLFQKMNFKNLEFNLIVDYLGFLVPDEFLIGFGLDYNEQFRNLDHLCAINKLGIEEFK